MRKLGISVEIMYGSGGYHVLLRDMLTTQVHSGYSWDIEEAFETAADKFQEAREKRLLEIKSSPETTKH